jgi:hypothetical protein
VILIIDVTEVLNKPAAAWLCSDFESAPAQTNQSQRTRAPTYPDGRCSIQQSEAFQSSALPSKKESLSPTQLSPLLDRKRNVKRLHRLRPPVRVLRLLLRQNGESQAASYFLRITYLPKEFEKLCP